MSDSPEAPAGRNLTVSFDLSRLPSATTALGVALVSAAVVVSTIYSRERGDLDGSNFAMGVLATVGLLVVAVGAHVLVEDAERRAGLVSWPGAAGVLGAGAMLAVLVDDDTWSVYLAGAVILVVSFLSHRVTDATPFVLTGILGLALLYAQAFGDLFGTEDEFGDDETSMIVVGAGVLFFVGAVTALGWLLPRTRVLSAVVVGAAAVAIFAFMFQAVFFLGTLAAFEGYESSDVEYSGSYEQLQGEHMSESYVPSEDSQFDEEYLTLVEDDFDANPYDDDVKVLLAYAAALALFWAACAAVTGHVAFRILSVAILVLSIPAATVALMVSHPTWWQVVLTGAGGLVLASVSLRLSKAQLPAQ